MDSINRYLRTKGIYAVIAAAVLIAVLLGAEYYMDIKDDDEEARKLVDRELRIAEMRNENHVGVVGHRNPDE